MQSFTRLFRNRKFMDLWFAQITSQVGLNMLFFVLAIRVYQETRSNIAVSFMLLTFSIPSIIFGIFAGGLVDYFDKRSIMMYCNLTRTLIFLLYFVFSPYLIMLYALSVITSCITQLFIPAEAPSISQLVVDEDLLTANSLFSMSFYLSTITGFIIAGPVLKMLGPKNIYLFIAVLLLSATYFAWRLPHLFAHKRTDTFSLSFGFISKVIREGMMFISSNIRVKQSLVLMTFSQATITTLSVLAPGFADRVIEIDLADASILVMGPAAVGLILGSLWVGGYGKTFLKRTIIRMGILGTGVILLLLAFLSSSKVMRVYFTRMLFLPVWTHLLLVVILLFLLGFFNAFVSVPAGTILQEDSKVDMRGRIYGVLTALTGGVSFLPVVFSGILADTIGVQRTLLVIGCIVALVGIRNYFQRVE